MRPFTVIGTEGDRRIALFQEALGRCGHAAGTIISYDDLLERRVCLDNRLLSETILRIESPGKNFETERILLKHGATDAPDHPFEHIPVEDVEQLGFEKGRIHSPYQWYLGLTKAMQCVESSLQADSQIMNHPADVLLMFDKTECSKRLTENGIPIPRQVGSVGSYGELLERMHQLKLSRVFFKLRHGSSASGAVAYRFSGNQHQAMTTVERVGDKLFNTRCIRLLSEQSAIASLIDALCQHPVHVEQWIPKAGIANKTFDLRVVVIAGKAKHVIVRMSETPMTNLHLLNQRGDVDEVRRHMTPNRWNAALETCERAMACFPHSLYGGVDLLISSDYRQHYVLEVNAFGDLLPGALFEGADTYTHEIQAMCDQ